MRRFKTKCLISAIFLLAINIGLVRNIYKLYLEMGWSKANATIVSTKVEGTGSQRELHMVYRYKFENTTYVTKEQFGGISVAKFDQEVEKHKKGSSIAICFDPNNPKESRLENETNIGLFWFNVVLLFFCVIFMIKLTRIGFS